MRLCLELVAARREMSGFYNFYNVTEKCRECKGTDIFTGKYILETCEVSARSGTSLNSTASVARLVAHSNNAISSRHPNDPLHHVVSMYAAA